MAEPVVIDLIGHDEIGEEDHEWANGKIIENETKLEELRHFNSRLGNSSHKDLVTLHSRKIT